MNLIELQPWWSLVEISWQWRWSLCNMWFLVFNFEFLSLVGVLRVLVQDTFKS